MKALVALLAVAMAGCRVEMDAGPVRSHTVSLDGGNAEMVRAEINMSAGELEVDGGAPKLMEGDFSYSEILGKPIVDYDATGFRGRLKIESPHKFAGGEITNRWRLRFGGKYPLELHAQMGAGEGKLNLATLPLRRVEMNIGAGELRMDLRGNYSKDVEVEIKGGVGSARIRLPKGMGVVADVKGGLGSIDTGGMTRRGDRYYNEAFSESKPAIRLTIRGGIGEIKLMVE